MRTEKRHAKVGEIILTEDGSFEVIEESKEMKRVWVVGETDTPAYIYDREYEVIIEEETDILTELESVRAEMNGLGEEFGLMHQKVIEASQRLDRIINRYEASKKEPE